MTDTGEDARQERIGPHERQREASSKLGIFLRQHRTNRFSRAAAMAAYLKETYFNDKEKGYALGTVTKKVVHLETDPEYGRRVTGGEAILGAYIKSLELRGAQWQELEGLLEDADIPITSLGLDQSNPNNRGYANELARKIHALPAELRDPLEQLVRGLYQQHKKPRSKKK